MKPLNSVLLVAMLVLSATCPMIQVEAKEVTGKVMAVFHEPTQTGDKVSVTVRSCASRNLETYSYNPGNVSDDNSLGYLFNHIANAARHTEQKNQYMNVIGGHVTLHVQEQAPVIQKTTFWGYNYECGRNVDGVSVNTGSAAPASTSQNAASTAPSSGSTSAPSSTTPASNSGAKPNGGGLMKRFGF